MNAIPNISSESDLITAREVFRRYESRDLFYRASRELIRLAIANQTEITLAEALGTLLKTWNASFYRFGRKFDEPHIQDIERAITRNIDRLTDWGTRTISSLKADEREAIGQVFSEFENIIGPVGAAKALHLLAPAFFPLWDTAIAARYRVRLRRIGENAELYLRFMDITKQQVSELTLSVISEKEVLKAIDEYNYCLITKKWK